MTRLNCNIPKLFFRSSMRTAFGITQMCDTINDTVQTRCNPFEVFIIPVGWPQSDHVCCRFPEFCKRISCIIGLLFVIKIRLKHSLKNIPGILGCGMRILFDLRKCPLNLDINRFESIFLDALIKR